MPDEVLLYALQQRFARFSFTFEQNDYIERLYLRFGEPLVADDARRVLAWIHNGSNTWLVEHTRLHYPTLQLNEVVFVRRRMAQVENG